MTYRHMFKHSWKLRKDPTKIFIIAKTFDDVKAMFRTYKRHEYQQALTVTFITHEEIGGRNEVIQEHFTTRGTIFFIFFKSLQFQTSFFLNGSLPLTT